MNQHFWNMGIVFLIVILSAQSTYDSASNMLSSRLGISLMLVLILAEVAAERPGSIGRTPKRTLWDMMVYLSFGIVWIQTLLNLVSVTMCGGEHEEAPAYMKKLYKENSENCTLDWCGSRKVDCYIL